MSTNITVVNKKGEQICQLSEVPIDTTVAKFKELFLNECSAQVGGN